MAPLAEHLEIVFFTEHAVDVIVPRSEAFVGIDNRVDVINLHVCGRELTFTSIALVMIS